MTGPEILNEVLKHFDILPLKWRGRNVVHLGRGLNPEDEYFLGDRTMRLRARLLRVGGVSKVVEDPGIEGVKVVSR
jgi:hypothetical protein